jgi:ubiquinone/menaquinone biosynthesis C-methylase UbiE
MNEQTDSDFLKNEAYEDASHLQMRQRLTERYRAREPGWFAWLYDQLALPTDGFILDLGCGPGDVWLKNEADVCLKRPSILTDLSSGMVADARQRLARSKNRGNGQLSQSGAFYFAAANAENIPFACQQFDVVLALGLLDHVPHRQQALAEIQRILKPHGRAYFSAGSPNHLQELNALLAPFLPEAPVGGDADRFGLHNGQALLSPFFQSISLTRYENELCFDSAEPILRYVLSETAVKDHLTPINQKELKNKIAQTLAQQGEIRLTVEKGLFCAGLKMAD